MRLQLPGCEEEFPCVQVALSRELGAARSWMATASVPHELREAVGGDIARAIDGGVREASCRIDSGEEPVAAVTGVVTLLRWREPTRRGLNEDQIEVRAIETHVKPDDHERGRPRSRVHQAKSLASLFRVLAPIVDTPVPIMNELAAYELPHLSDQEDACVLQAEETDWEFLMRLLRHCRGVSPSLDLTLTGGAARAEERGRWQVVPARGRLLDRLEMSERCLLSEEDMPVDSKPRVAFGGSRMPMPWTSAYPVREVPVVFRQYRALEASERVWKSWWDKELPLHLGSDGGFVRQIRDWFVPSGEAGTVEWTIEVATLSAEIIVELPAESGRVGPWVGLGKVTDVDSQRPWLEVELEGFEEKAAMAQVRLTTQSSGENGRSGLHLLPAQGSQVVVFATGSIGDPLMSLGSVRSEAVDLPAPSTDFSSEARARFTEISVPSVGTIQVDSGLSCRIAKPSSIAADGAKLRLEGGDILAGNE